MIGTRVVIKDTHDRVGTVIGKGHLEDHENIDGTPAPAGLASDTYVSIIVVHSDNLIPY